MAIKKGTNPNLRKRSFIISWNNYPPSLSLEKLKLQIINKAHVEYLILGFEKGEIKGTPHIQGYVRFTNPITLTSFEKIFKNDNGSYGYVDYAYGTDAENQKYDSKQNNYLEYGYTKTENEIKKDNELSNIIDDIIDGLDFTELCKKYYKYILYHYRDFKELYNDINQLNAHKRRNIDEIIKHINDDDLFF